MVDLALQVGEYVISHNGRFGNGQRFVRVGDYQIWSTFAKGTVS